MKRNLRFLALVLAAILVASSLFPLTFVRGERLYQPGNSNSLSALAQESSAVLVQGPKDYSQDIDKVLRHYDKVQLDPARSAALVHQTRRLMLPTSEGNFDLTLELRDMRSAGYRAQETLDGGVIRELEDQPVRTYKGSVAGMPEAQARLTIDEDTLEGLIITPGQIYFIEPAKHYSALAQRTDFVIYKQSDLLQASFGECGVTLAEKVGAEAARVHSDASGLSVGQDKGAAALFSPPRTVDLATEADFEYYTAFGSSAAANNEIIGVMNQVEGIYNTQFGLQFSLVFQNVWSTVGDPYSSTDASTALDEFSNYWNANHGSVFRDLAHMWTGKSFNGSTIGIAWQPGLDCPLAANGYGMSERLSSAPGKFIVTAHEIGHNFNATHADAQPGCANTIMGTTLNPSTSQTFCAFSVNEIDARANAKAACLSQVLTPGCTYTLSATSRSFSASGGTGSVNVSTVGSNCVWAANSSASWITITAGNSGTNGGTVSYSVNLNGLGYPRTGILRIAEQDFVVSQAGSGACPVTPIGIGETVNGGLGINGNACRSSLRGSYADQYAFTGAAGEQISIALSRTGSSTIDTYLYLIGPSGAVVTENDDVDSTNLNSRIPPTGFFALPVAGRYVIEVTSYGPNETGTYSLVLSSSTPNTVQFSQPTFTAAEGDARVNVTVSRTGNTSGSASVAFVTSDSAGLNNCSVNNGAASSRCDYAASVGTINFAAGETSKTFSIPIVDDSYAEVSETFRVNLTSASGTTLGSQVTTTVTITDNEGTDGVNPIGQTAFFVRQHYIDFLGREPDPGGFAGWQDVINNCAAGDTNCDRIHVSSAFFRSAEFQERGYFVYRFYPVSFGRKPDYAEFVPDIARVSGFLSPAELDAAKLAFINDFMARGPFTTKFNGQSDLQYVDLLLSTAGVTSANHDRWVTLAATSRAQVLKEISESPEVYNKYYNQAFVVMQYFGYLRRDPDALYLNWIQVLDTSGDFRGMVDGFVNSNEYRFRFGP